MGDCCWHPDPNLFGDNFDLRRWSDATNGWVLLPDNPTSDDWSKIFTGVPFFFSNVEERGVVNRAWQVIQTGLAQKIQDLKTYAHFGEAESLYAYRSDYSLRRSGSMATVRIVLPDEFLESAGGIAYRSKFGTILSDDYDDGLDAICQEVHDSNIEVNQRFGAWVQSQPSSDLYDEYPKIDCEPVSFPNAPLHGGSWRIVTHWLTNHGSMMKTEVQMSWKPHPLGNSTMDPVVPYVVVAESDAATQSLSESVRGASPIDSSDEQTVEDELNQIYGDDYQLRNLSFELWCNDNLFLLSAPYSRISRWVNGILQYFSVPLATPTEIRHPQLADFFLPDNDAVSQINDFLWFRRVQEYSPPNTFLHGGAG